MMISNKRSSKLSRRERTPTMLEQAVLVAGMLVSGLIVYFWVIGL
jgi:hypothetical protein